MIAQIVGYLGNDAEVKETNGRNFVRFSIADTIRVKGEDQTVWVTCFSNMTGMAPHLKKGKQIFVTGELNPGVHEGKLDLSMSVHSIKFVGRKDDHQNQ